MAKIGGGSYSDWEDRSNFQKVFDPGGGLEKYLGIGKKRTPAGTPVGDAYAALTRDQWYTYMNTFVPIENKLIEYATSPTVVADAMKSASEDTAGAFASAQASSDRRLKGLGVTLDADEKKASDRSFGLAASLADVGAQNTARDATRQRQQSILGNPAPDAISI